jgi:hypothetical protein
MAGRYNHQNQSKRTDLIGYESPSGENIFKAQRLDFQFRRLVLTSTVLLLNNIAAPTSHYELNGIIYVEESREKPPLAKPYNPRI